MALSGRCDECQLDRAMLDASRRFWWWCDLHNRSLCPDCALLGHQRCDLAMYDQKSEDVKGQLANERAETVKAINESLAKLEATKGNRKIFREMADRTSARLADYETALTMAYQDLESEVVQLEILEKDQLSAAAYRRFQNIRYRIEAKAKNFLELGIEAESVTKGIIEKAKNAVEETCEEASAVTGN